MKHTFISFVSFLLLGSVFAGDYTGLDAARALSEENIIVDYSTIAGNSELQETSLYRLDAVLIRQEALGIALKLKNITLPEEYLCMNYFGDTKEAWVCRAAEIAADNHIITRVNTLFRPKDVLTVAEAIGIAVKTLNIPLSSSETSTINRSIPNWQKRLLLTLIENNITLTIENKVGLDSDISKKITRGQFFEIIVALMTYKNNKNPVDNCLTYTDGCNECEVTNGEPTCTERACIGQGVPACYSCEAGYSLENNHCVKTIDSCVKEGGYAGGGHVIGPENPDDFMCCSGLTRAERSDGTTFADAGYTCIREGDDICDGEYESSDNSSDCREKTVFNASLCQSYFDGCNSCSRGSDGNTACTMMACFVQSPAYCTSYIPYVPKTESTDRALLGEIGKEIRNFAQNLSCADTDQCRWKMAGTRACGGPSIAIPYSTKNTNEALLDTKALYLTDAEKIFNIEYGIMSDCMVIAPPAPMECINNLCR